jgi:hypothetical protein
VDPRHRDYGWEGEETRTEMLTVNHLYLNIGINKKQDKSRDKKQG